MKNLLMIYRGGGYDGCHWEWNAGYFDEVGEWVSLGHSGFQGIPSARGPDKTKNQDEAEATAKGLHTLMQIGTSTNKGGLYRLMSRKHMLQFSDDFGPALVMGVVRRLQEIFRHTCGKGEVQAVCCCDKCHGVTGDMDELRSMDPSSDGGLVVSDKTKICDDCFYNGCCADCAEESSSPEELYDSQPLFNGYCFFHALEDMVRRGPVNTDGLPEEVVEAVGNMQEFDRLNELGALTWESSKALKEPTKELLGYYFVREHKDELEDFLKRLADVPKPDPRQQQLLLA